VTALRSGSPATGDRPPGATRRDWLGFGALLTGMFVVQVDFFIVNVALPPIQQDFGAGLSDIQLVAVSYASAVGLTVVTGGRLGDLYGRRRLFVIGVLGIALASLLCGLAWSGPALAVARILQGVAAGLVMPQGIGSIHAMFDGEDRERAFAVFGAVMGLSWASGMLFGGLLLGADVAGLGWRSIFLINVPLALAAAVGARVWLVESHRPGSRGIDLVGVVALTAVTGLVLYPLIQGRQAGWPGWTYVSLGSAVVAAVVLFRFERRVAARGRTPVLPPELFGIRPFRVGLLVIALFFLGPPGYFLLTSLYLQNVLGFSPFHSGLSLLPFSMVFFLSAYLAKRLKSRLGEMVIVLGCAAMVAGTVTVALTVVSAGGNLTIAVLAPGVAVLGFGQALVTTPLYEMLLREVPKDVAATASGVFTTIQLVAQQVGVALAVIVCTFVAGYHLPSRAAAEARSTAEAVRTAGGSADQGEQAAADVRRCAEATVDDIWDASRPACATAPQWSGTVHAAVEQGSREAAARGFADTLLGYNLATQVLTALVIVGHAARTRRRS
jgi:EmrB/QacA subfamily drug resistance transporter